MNSTIIDVAKKANVSISTVSKYINGKNVLPEYREKISLAIQELKYEPNVIAKGLKNSRSYSIGILSPTVTDIFTSSVASYLSRELEKNGYSLMIADYNADRNIFIKKANFFRQKKIDAVFIFPEGLLNDDLAVFEEMGIPMFALDRPFRTWQTDVIRTDHFEAGYRIGKLFIEKKIYDPLIICSIPGVYSSERRREGVVCAYADEGLDVSRVRVTYTSKTPNGNKLDLKEYFSDKAKIPKAVFCVDYYVALNTIAEAIHYGIDITKEIYFTSIDNFDILKLLVPNLTYIEQDIGTIAKKAVQILKAKLQGGAVHENEDVKIKGILHMAQE